MTARYGYTRRRRWTTGQTRTRIWRERAIGRRITLLTLADNPRFTTLFFCIAVSKLGLSVIYWGRVMLDMVFSLSLIYAELTRRYACDDLLVWK